MSQPLGTNPAQQNITEENNQQANTVASGANAILQGMQKNFTKQAEEWKKGRLHTCRFTHENGTSCQEIAPFLCKQRVLCKDIGCIPDGKTEETSRFCRNHKGELSLLFLQNFNFGIDGDHNQEYYLCKDHAKEANIRTYCIFGLPLLALIIFAVVCLVYDVMWIVQGINDTTFEMTQEDYDPTTL